MQAAIAALHDEAADVAATDWPQIVALYDVLRTLTPSPVVEVNRAVAVAMRDGPGPVSRCSTRWRGSPSCGRARRTSWRGGILLARLGRDGEAAAAYREALSRGHGAGAGGAAPEAGGPEAGRVAAGPWCSYSSRNTTTTANATTSTP